MTRRSFVSRAAQRSRLPPGRPPWTRWRISLLGKIGDAEVTRRFRIPYHAVRNKRIALGIKCFAGTRRKLWQPKWDKELGTDSDRVVAGRLGVSVSSVYTRRAMLGIKSAGGPRGRHRVWDRKWDKEVGTEYDRVIATRRGVSVNAVRLRRMALGVRALPSSVRGTWKPVDLLPPRGKRTERFLIRVSVSLMKRLKSLARSRGESLGDVTNAILESVTT